MTPGPRVSRLWRVTAPLLALLVGAVVVVLAMPLPYVTLSPGSARSVEPLVNVAAKPGGPEVTVDPASDDLLFLTVSTMTEPSGIVVVQGWFDDTVQVEPSAPFLGTQSSDENRKLNLALMTDSQDKARKVALERLGYTVETNERGAFLEDVDPDYPASKVLKPGMTVVRVGDDAVGNVDDLVAALQKAKPGDTVALEVIPLGEREPRRVEAKLGARPGDPDDPLLGVAPVDRVTYEFPVDITIDSGKVGGPSAGLAFTLAILDRMTPGSLTGDDRVALTGTIELDGTVGPVGGVRHKTEAAIRQGAEVILVPPDEFEGAKEAARGRIDVESVASLDEALAVLKRRGGSGLPNEKD